jgi:adenylate cyclase
MRLSRLHRCFQGVIPSQVSTCDKEGIPNTTYVSQVHYLDDTHVALSCQFFNKTKKNVMENPYACVTVPDPLTGECYQLDLKYLRSEDSGPLFDSMAARIEAIASHTGMKGVFRLISADIYEVLEVRPVAEMLPPPEAEDAVPESVLDPVARPRNEIRGIALLSERISRARDLEALFKTVLEGLSEAYSFEHSMLLLPDESGKKLFAVASRGYGESGIGAEIELGQGVVGIVADERKIVRIGDVSRDLRYGRAVRKTAGDSGLATRPEIPMPGLPDAASLLALPLVYADRLVGVLAVESRAAHAFDEWHEAFLGLVATQVAMAIDRMSERDEDEPPPSVAVQPKQHGKVRRFTFYRNDDCVFVDGEYLIRNVPGKILWKILTTYAKEHRNDFCNRELRLDPSLGLPAVKDNLESRLILLRKRLEERCPDVRLAQTGRGLFRLELDASVELNERESA